MNVSEVSKEIYGVLKERLTVIFFLYEKSTGKITEANNFAFSVFGEDVLKKSIRDVFLDFSGELPFDSLGKDGSEKMMISVAAVSILPQTFLFTFRDMGRYMIVIGEPDYPNSELLQEHLFISNSELANLARDLQKKNAELERMGRIKNEFLGMAAHDLRNPIGNIRNLSQFLLDELEGKLTDPQLLFLSTIKSQSDFLSHVIGDLLDVSALESGSVRLDRKRFKLKPFIERIVALNQGLAAKKNIVVRPALCPPDIELFADPNKMEQVFNNLIDNAVKYSPPGTEVEIEISAEEKKVAVRITDRGIGIAEKDIPRLFKPFAKIEAAGTSGEKSTGLGLSIVQHIVMAHGGLIRVLSTPGKGSTFIVEIPRGEAGI